MLCPGMVFGAGSRIAATIGLGTAASQILQGVGFMANGNLALDTTASAPSPTSFTKGIAQNASGAFFAIVATQLPTDTFVEGIRVSILGQIVIESADAAGFASGNPITAAGNFSVN
jgi:hypothetical protein